MTFYRFYAAACLLIGATAQSACERAKPKPPKEAIGHVVTQLKVNVGGTWETGYSLTVIPEEYAVLEHRSCADAKDPRFPEDRADGLCVVRLTKEQSNRFETAMERFKKNSIPLESYSFESPFLRPDGKPCRNEVTDAAIVSLLWTGSEGKIATFYLGCDEKEFSEFYKTVLSLSEPLPVLQIKDR